MPNIGPRSAEEEWLGRKKEEEIRKNIQHYRRLKDTDFVRMGLHWIYATAVFRR